MEYPPSGTCFLPTALDVGYCNAQPPVQIEAGFVPLWDGHGLPTVGTRAPEAHPSVSKGPDDGEGLRDDHPS